MGAHEFMTEANGKTAEEAFRTAVNQAEWEYGHAGYTGTIAEKMQFVMIPLPAGEDPYDYADKLIRDGDDRIDDKWGPAGCIALSNDAFLFFGWASS